MNEKSGNGKERGTPRMLPRTGRLLIASHALCVGAALLLTGCGSDSSSSTSPATSHTQHDVGAAESGSPSAEPRTSGSPAQDDAPSNAADSTIALTVTKGKVTGVAREESVGLGKTVLLKITSDTADEVHVHGYDRHVDVTPGEPAVLRFRAAIPGVFHVELETAGLELFSLKVQ